jgi:hypothetical protein
MAIAGWITVVDSESLLLPGVGSEVLPVMTASLVMEPGALVFTVTVNTMLPEAPAASVGPDQVN